MISITADKISKDFNHRTIFQNISFALSSPASLAITGDNGVGKSTLSKILAGIINTTHGSLTYSFNDLRMDIEEFKPKIGFVAPYLNFYDEFSAVENIKYLSRMRSPGTLNEQKLHEILHRVHLWHRKDDPIGTYSSGMKQRLKYAFALFHEPEILILDEPTSNLDTKGIEFVESTVKQQMEKNILIIATSDTKEARWCAHQIPLRTIV